MKRGGRLGRDYGILEKAQGPVRIGGRIFSGIWIGGKTGGEVGE